MYICMYMRDGGGASCYLRKIMELFGKEILGKLNLLQSKNFEFKYFCKVKY